jgi:hypothetical protein
MNDRYKLSKLWEEVHIFVARKNNPDVIQVLIISHLLLNNWQKDDILD